MDRPRWDDDHGSTRSLWALDPNIDHLNHGSFGACPREVLAAQDEWRARIESDPVEMLYRRLPGLLLHARTVAAEFLGAETDDLVLVPNATTAINTVLAALELRDGDEIVTTDHAYPAVLDTLESLARRCGVRARIVAVPLPISDDVPARITAALTSRTKLVIADHIASSTAAVFPIDDMVAACREAGVPVMVDAAHAPGMVDVNLARLGADFWTGNFHKWCCAPKGSAALVVASSWHDRVRPLVTSHAYLRGWAEPFGWTGTYDPSAFLSVPAALEFMANLGWQRVRAYNNALARFGQEVVHAAVGDGELIPSASHLAVVPLRHGVAANAMEGQAVAQRLHDEFRVEAPVPVWRGRAFVRISAQVYNSPEQYERLAATLRSMFG